MRFNPSHVPLVLRSLIVCGLVCLLLGCGNAERKASKLLEDAEKAMAREDYPRAEGFASNAAKLNPELGQAYLIAGDAAQEQDEIERALEWYGKVKGDDKSRAEGHVRTAELLLHKRQDLTGAEKELRAAIALDENHEQANDGMAYLLSLTGRRWESTRYFLPLIKRGKFNLGHLHGIGVTQTVLRDLEQFDKPAEGEIADTLIDLGLARILVKENRTEEARIQLEGVIARRPDLLEAQGRYGQILALKALPQFEDWHSRLPANADEHPEIWIARAEASDAMGDRDGAIRAYLEAIKRAPNHQPAVAQAATRLNAAGEEELAAKLAERSALLIRFQEALAIQKRNPDDLESIRSAATYAEQLGRLWEARAWLQTLLRREPDNEQLRSEIERLNTVLANGPPQTLPEAIPVAGIDLAQWPLPSWAWDGERVANVSNEMINADIRFENVADQLGLEFTYYNGHRPGRIGTFLFEVDGGGVAILDFDGDRYPDLFCTQGTNFPDGPRTDQYLDRLFRNVDGSKLVDVTEICGIRETGFGQGVTVADFDNDGFDDLFVANIGGNRLYHNLGDGTFEDVTESAGIAGEQWTASCVIADLNQDGFPDIYEVNYLRGDDLHTRICPDAEGRPRICQPILFDGEFDKLYLSQGDGKFVDASKQAGIDQLSGRGLGVVVADFDRSGRLSLFIANDVVENFYLRPSQAEGEPLKYEEVAVLYGLAMDANGQSQACMGVAADDANGDGLVDLFITNFYTEFNCLYQQNDDTTFADRTIQAGLAQPSYSQLGFGTQFLDADLDGHPDLLVANGHLVDESDLGIPYRMPTQLFRNGGGARFEQVKKPSLGSFFSENRLGRGMALLDVDRDGKEDAVIGDLEKPYALLVNRSEETGKYLTVHLSAAETARNAVGAEVTVITDNGRQRVRQLTAGSGYQCANHRALVFGLGDAAEVKSLSVRWPSGAEQSFPAPSVNSEVLLVEGADRAYELPK